MSARIEAVVQENKSMIYRELDEKSEFGISIQCKYDLYDGYSRIDKLENIHMNITHGFVARDSVIIVIDSMEYSIQRILSVLEWIYNQKSYAIIVCGHLNDDCIKMIELNVIDRALFRIALIALSDVKSISSELAETLRIDALTNETLSGSFQNGLKCQFCKLDKAVITPEGSLLVYNEAQYYDRLKEIRLHEYEVECRRKNELKRQQEIEMEAQKQAEAERLRFAEEQAEIERGRIAEEQTKNERERQQREDWQQLGNIQDAESLGFIGFSAFFIFCPPFKFANRM